jgi:hypothetical protein
LYDQYKVAKYAYIIARGAAVHSNPLRRAFLSSTQPEALSTSDQPLAIGIAA